MSTVTKIQYMCVLFALLSFLCPGMKASAKYGDAVEWQGRTVAIMDEQGQMIYQPIGDNGELETQALQYLLGNDKKKTLMIPEGTVLNLNETLEIGNNTTLLVTGATMIQTKANTCLLSNEVDQEAYQSLKNVRIQGGIWKNKLNTKAYCSMCFIQASNVTIENATILSCTLGNGIRLAGCKNVNISACEIRAEKPGRKTKAQERASIEIVPATPLLTRDVRSVANEDYVKGQECENISVKGCIVHGSLGIYAGYAKQEKKYREKLHNNVKIVGCTVTGTETEALSLENTIAYTVKNNLLISRAKTKEGIHASAMLAQLSAKKVRKKAENLISGNVLYGSRYGILVRSKTKGRYGKTRVQRNRSHVAGKKKNAIVIKNCRKKVIKNNKSYSSK